MSSLSQALHLDYLPSSHSAFQDHAAHNAGWSACLDPTAHGVPVYPRVLPHSSIMLHGARYVRDTCLCPKRHKHVYLADQIMPRSSLSTAFPLGKSLFHVCPTRHNPDMGCFSLLVHPRRKGEAYDRARIYTYLCNHPL